MATHTSHAPTPTDGTQYLTTDDRPLWPFLFAIIYGTLAAIIGWVASAWPVVFIGLIALGLIILWLLRRIGQNSLGTEHPKTRLAAARTQDCLAVMFWMSLAGLGGWVIGKMTGTLLIDVITWLASVSGILALVLATIMLAAASILLLMAAGYRARTPTIIFLVVFGIVVAFMTQQAVTITQTPFEQVKKTCTSQQAQDFPAECK